MNVSDLEVPPPQHVQRVSTEASDKEADFLSLRLLNKRARVKLSPEPLDLQPLPGKGQLFVVANSKGWFVAAIRNASSDISLIFSPLTDLRTAFTNATPETAEVVFKPKRTLNFSPATPNILCFASADSRLIVGITQGPILVFDSSRLFTAGSEEITPLHSFPSTTSTAPRQIIPNPGDMPDLVVILREMQGNTSSQLVEVLDVTKLESIGGWRGGNSPEATPTSISWSPKGKQIAVGLQSGDIITFSPTETNKPKFVFGKPLSANNQSVIAMTWLSNTTIHTIYAPPGPLNPDAEQTHLVVSLDPKKNTAADIKLMTPYFPSPAIRPPGSFVAVLRNWEPARLLLFAGDSTSSDIGVLGTTQDDSWHNFSLEETSTPSLPLDKDMNDTVLMALELDLTSTETHHHTSASGETFELPPPPIMYAYASDGTLLGWVVVNIQGGAYPGMVASPPAISALTITSSISQNDMQMTSTPITPVTGPSSDGAFGQPSQPTFGQSSFGKLQPPQPTFGQPSAFGQSSQPSSSFGQPSAFGQSPSPSFGQSSPPFGSSAPTTGFGSFSAAGPAKFGQSSFGFGGSSSPAPPESALRVGPSTSAEDPMASNETTPFSGLSLGSTSGVKSVPAFGSGSTMFGQTALSPPASNPEVKPGSGSGSGVLGAIKPASGFGAFSNLNSQPNAFGTMASKETNTSEAAKPASAFGKSGFEAKSSGAFGQPAFGHSNFGQSGGSAFGKSSFGVTSAPIEQTTNRGFGAFASGKPSAFSTVAVQGARDEKPAEVKSGGFSAFAQKGPTSFASAASKASEDSKPVWATGNGFGSSEITSENKQVFGDVAGSSEVASGSSPARKPYIVSSNSAFSMRDAISSASPDLKPLSPPSSPEPTSPPLQTNKTASSLFGKDKHTTPPSSFSDSTTPVSSPFKSGSPASGSGAFGQLKTSSTGFFKPAEGFGAFGSNVNKDSPFYNPPIETGVKPKSVFTSVSTPVSTAPKTGSTTPIFGSTSTPGSSKPTFGSPSALGTTSKPPFNSPSSIALPATPIPEPSSGGFGAFSNNSGFSGFSGAQSTSFGDLLRGGEEAVDPTKPKTPVLETPSKSPQDAKSLGTTIEKSRPSTPTSHSNENNLSTLTQSKPEVHEQTASPIRPTSTIISDVPTAKLDSDDSLVPQGKDENKKKGKPNNNIGKGKGKETVSLPGTPGGLSLDSSLASISASSQNSSFVEVTPPSDEEEDISSHPKLPDKSSDSGSDLEGDARSFLSESFSSDEVSDEVAGEESSAGSVSEDDDEEQSPPEDTSEGDAETAIPSTVPLSNSRSPSTTPKPEPSKRQSSRSPSPLPTAKVSSMSARDDDSSIPVQYVRSGSATPPGSPPQEESLSLPPKAPVPVSAVLAPASLGLGLGRPSTRPARSSPLANAPLSPEAADDGDDKRAAHDLSTPSLPKPASPKPYFGLWGAGQVQKAPTVDSKFTEPSQSKRPKTPPLLSVGSVSSKSVSSGSYPPSFSSSSLSVPKAASIAPTQAPAGQAALSLASQKSTAPSPETPPTPGSLFGDPSALATPPSSTSSTNFFGLQSSGTLPASESAIANNTSGKFGSVGISVNKYKQGFGQTSDPSYGFSGQQSTPGLSAPVSPAPLPEPERQGLQAECAYLYELLNKELENLQQMAQKARRKRDELNKSSGRSHHKNQLMDPSHWTISDVKTWGQVLKTLDSDIEILKDNKTILSASLRELESSMLRAGTKKEEIVRFNKAKTDPEFAKMLKIRTLGPEHLETQSQLRRDIRAMRDRVQKLEDHLQASKKRLNQVRTGKPGLRAPTLDTINRTYRNIDIAVEHQAQQVAQLNSRFKKLKVSSAQLSLSSSTRDNRLPDQRRPHSSTSSVMVNAANALNGERAAARLKQALLSTRREPLLNTKAATAPAAPAVFTTPQKLIVKAEPQSPDLSLGLESLSSSQPWNPAPFDESPSHDLGPRRRAGVGSNRHGPSPKLKRTPTTSPSPSGFGQSPPAASFDWGPLPTVVKAKGLPFGFAKSTSPAK